MKKSLLMLAGALLIGQFGFSQYWSINNANAGMNPGGLNTDDEVFTQQGLAPGWTQVAAGPLTNWTAAQTIPFSFNFNGGTVTSYKISPNGAITFSNAALSSIGSTPSTLPAGNVPDSTILFWGLSLGDANDRIGTKTFGTAPNRQHWINYVSAKSAGTQTGWVYCSIVLEETTGKIYLVDQRIACVSGQNWCQGRPALTLGVQIDNSTYFEVAGSPNYGGTAGNDATPADNGYVTLIPGTQPADEIELQSIDMKDYLKLGDAPFDIQGGFRNNGSAVLNNYDLSYTVNGGSAVTATINAGGVPSTATSVYKHTTQWNPTTAGVYTIEVTASNPNGNTDPDMSNNTMSFTVNVIDTFIQRKPLYEIYTSSTCGPCRPGNQVYHGVVANYPDEYTEIKFQQNFPGTGDPYCTDETVNRRGFYSINSIPRMEIDGGWDANASSFTAQLHEDAKAVPAFINFEGTNATIGGDTVNGDVNVELNVKFDALQDYSGTNTLFATLFEKKTEKNVKTNGETEFENVAKKMMPDENGTNIGAITKGQQGSQQLTFKIAGSYRLPSDGAQGNRIDNATEHSVEEFTDLGIIVWIQDANKNVLQSAYAPIEFKYTTPASVEGVDADNSVAMYPNPARDVVNFDLVSETNIEIYDLNGKLVYSAEGLNSNHRVDLSEFNAGVYSVRISSNDFVQTERLVVQ